VWLTGHGTSIDKQTLTDLRRRQRAFTGLGAWSGWGFTLTKVDTPDVLNGVMVTSDLFDLLGARSAAGRSFLEARDGVGVSEAILSDALWRRRFGARADTIGTSLVLNGRPTEIVGIMPPGFAFPDPIAEIWVSTLMNPADTDDWTAGYLRVVGRLAPGATPPAAQADLRAATRAMRVDRPGAYGGKFGTEAATVALRVDLVGDTGPALLLLLGAVGFVLLVACGNVANLLLSRGLARRGEIAVRAALGAGPRRIARQLMTESLVLALCGGGLGALLASWAVSAMSTLLPAGVPGVDRIAVDGRILVATLVLSALVGVVSGAAPALRAVRGRIFDLLSAGTLTPGRPPVGARSLVAVEIATTLVLVAGAGLMVRSYWGLSHEDPGFQAGRVLSLRLSPARSDPADLPLQQAFWHEVQARLEKLPGVEAVGAIHLLPLGGGNWNPELEVEGRPLAPDAAGPEVDWRVVTGRYFEALGIPLLQGRRFGMHDDATGAPVALINRRLAVRVFGGENPIGRRVATGFEGQGKWVTIVGVVGDTKDQTLGGEARPQIYRPLAQTFPLGMTLMVRAAGDPSTLVDAVRRTVWGVDPDVPVSAIQPLAAVVGASLRQARLVALLLTGFGFLALVLGAVGIYGVMSTTVAHRRQEWGVRLALGARGRDLLLLMLGETGRIVGAGLILGLGGALFLTRLLESQLYRVDPSDPASLALAAVILGAAAFAAALLPALRAARTDPLVCLRGR